MQGWVQKPLYKELFKEFGCQVFIQNDTVMVGLGECWYGPGKDEEIVVYLTVSTGVGGAVFVNGEVEPSAMGFEPGHQIIDYKSGTDLEGLVGGAAMEKREGRRAEDISGAEFWDDIALKLAIGLNNTIVHWSPNMIILGGGMMQENSNGIKIGDVTKHLTDIVKIFPKLPKIEKGTLGSTGGLYGALVYTNQQLKGAKNDN